MNKEVIKYLLHNPIKFIKYNYFCKNVKRSKGSYLFLRKGSILSLAKGSKLVLNGSLYLNMGKYKGSKAESYLVLDSNAIMEVKGTTRFNYGATIHVNSNKNLSIGSLSCNVGLNLQCACGVTIGNDCMVGRNTTIFDSSFHPTGSSLDSAKVTNGEVVIGDHVWLGAYTFVMQGTTIEDCAIISAGSTVRGHIDGFTTTIPELNKPASYGTYWARSMGENHLVEASKYYKNIEAIELVQNEEINNISMEILEVLQENFNGINFNREEKLIEDHIVDSLAVVNIVCLLSEHFKLTIPFKQVSAVNFNSVNRMANLIYRLKKNLNVVDKTANDVIDLPISKELVDLDENNSKKTVVERIFEHAKNTPTEPAIICNDEIVTYDEISRLIITIANILTDKGVVSGDRVAVQAFHNKYCVSTYYAIHLLGSILVPLEKSAAKDRMLEIANDTEAKYIIANAENDGRFVNYDTLIEEITNYKKELKLFNYPSIDMPCEMVFTTGTTGKSKGVLMRHKDISWYSYALARFISMKKHNRFFITTPLNHAGGLRRTHLSLSNGCCVVYMDGINDLGKYFDYIRKYKITALYLPPVAIRILLTRTGDELNKYKDQIDFVYSSSSSLPTGDCEKMKELLPNTRLYNAYEASETPGVSAYDYNTDNVLRNCLGQANFGVELCILKDDDTMTTDANVEGQVCVRSKMNMKEYYNAPEISKTVWNGDWFVSNDLGFLDENKNLFYCGRKGDVINIGGYKIAPTDVEEVALKSGQLSECICIAIKDAIGIEMLELLVIPNGDSFDKNSLIEYMSSKLELYKVPRKITIVDKIEKTFNGKINRKYYRK